MNASTLVAKWNKRRKAMALVMVVTTVALMSMLVVAIFSVTRTEYKSTQSYVASRSAKQLADLAVVFTEAQLQNAQNTATGSFSRTIHATQPGMARVYQANGDFVRAHKLYSSSQMVITSSNEADIFNSTNQIPTDWNSSQNLARYVDLNEPVVRPGLTTGTMAVYFPIIDPRAAYNGTNPTSGQTMVAVEGFSYTKTTPAITGAGGTVTYNEVVTPSDAGNDPNKLRLPMPVEWIYVLKDGTTGALDASNKFISADGATTPSASNPIIGRVAFWTDDESCKVNINTASEPTFFAPPYFYHQRDSKWANFPPSSGEYQRYPGHPATVALSAVLAPGVGLDVYAPNARVTDIITTKDAIYRLIPKIAMGGSTSGTKPFVRDDFSGNNGENDVGSLIDITNSRKERLFASVDEMLFADGVSDSSYNYNTTNGRVASTIALPGNGSRYLFDHDTVERSRFFLTASSRSPEFSIHGLPRIAMWPVPDESLGKARRTSFDAMIALCSTLRGKTAGPAIANSYMFRRAQPHDPTFDVTGSSSEYGSSTSLARNSRLLEYLYAEMATLQFPQTSSLGGSPNFSDKYGSDNVAQLAIMFFDYIRCTNLYDGVLARNNDGYTPWYNANIPGLGNTNKTAQSQAIYNTRTNIANDRFTFTEQRVTPKASGGLNNGQAQIGSSYVSSFSDVFPGHGQVSPARWQRTGGQVVQGLGRMFTLSEIGFQFICTADGYIAPNDPYAVNCGGVLSGGGNAPKGLPRKENLQAPSTNPGLSKYDSTIYPPPAPTNGSPYLDYKRWYSNFPPLDGKDNPPYGGGRLYGCDPTDVSKHPYFHPGYNPANWNMTLETNKWLAADEKRVQVMLSLEFFCPMSGWTKMFPEWAIMLDGEFIRSIKLDDSNGTPTPLFPTTTDVIVKSNGNVYETGSSGSYPLGGHVGPSIISGGRSGPGWNAAIGDDTNPYVVGTARSGDPSAYNANPGSNNNYHDGLNNWGLISKFITVKRNQQMHLSFGKRELVIKIYDMHKRAGQSNQEVQSISVAVQDAYVPVPALVYSSNERFVGGKPVTEPLGRGEISYYYWLDSYGRETFHRSTQAPHWWCFNRMGCLNRMTGSLNKNYKGPLGLPPSTRQLYLTGPSANTDMTGPFDQLTTGRLDTDGRFLAAMSSGNATFDSTGNSSLPLIPVELDKDYSSGLNGVVTDANGNTWTGSDVIRTFVPAVGDYRLAAARRTVPSTMWMKHPVWEAFSSQPALNQPRNIHSFTSHWANTEPGCLLPGDTNLTRYPNIGMKKTQQLVAGAPYSDARVPDLPPSDGWAATANSFGDFDNGIGNARDGAYVNKPDEGNFFAGVTNRYSVNKFYRSGYFYNAWQNSDDWRTGIYMTPNRMVSSPVMFGSLPTGVWSGGSVRTSAVAGGVSYSEGKPWQTLLFRPHASSNANYGKGITPGHPGDNNPRDHYLLDLFYMPVVEPYAISEPLSIAGRLNLNYQIVPFTNITRATGMYAVMKGEFMTAIPLSDTENAKNYQTAATSSMWSSSGDRFWDEANNSKFWHRPIDVTKTLYQFDQKFQHTATGTNHNLSRFRGLFRSPSQICEIHLIPDVSKGASSGGEILGSIGNINANTTGSSLQSVMEQFWQSHPGTGDNTRERPYSNIYARVTTRSNTFRVHMRAQVITKARSTSPDTMDPTKDAILGEYRGSALIERYIDPTDVSNPLPDYAATSNPLAEKPLDYYYKFRTLESKRFSP